MPLQARPQQRVWETDVRDTDTHVTDMVEMGNVTGLAFRVQNTANQTVTLRLVGNSGDIAQSETGNLTADVTVTANRQELFTVDLQNVGYTPYKGLAFEYGTGPTSGGPIIIAYAQEDV